IVRTFFDFSDAAIDLTGLRFGRIQGRLKTTLAPKLPAGTVLSGRCHFVEQHVITAFNWPANPY
ncbi:MAG: hypothetical protein QOI13_3614, partial [Paraburkholderia sp.]|nr:hypothetical protein [Paraburkholderia sp.]